MEKLSKQGKSLKNFTYNDKETADEIYSAINSTQFIGVSVSKYRQKLLSPAHVRNTGIDYIDRLGVYAYRVTSPLVRKVIVSP
jgi:hypothetical protein